MAAIGSPYASVERDPRVLAICGLIAAGAALALIGATRPWIAGYAWSQPGMEIAYGRLAFVASLCILAISAYRIVDRDAKVWYPLLAALLGIFIVAMTIAVLVVKVGAHDPTIAVAIVERGPALLSPRAGAGPRVAARYGVFVTLAGGVVCAVGTGLMFGVMRRERA